MVNLQKLRGTNGEWHSNIFLLLFIYFSVIPAKFENILKNVDFNSFEANTLYMIITILLELALWNSEQKNGLLIKLFLFSSDFDETWWSCSVLQFHQALSKSDEIQKSFINSPFFCSEFQSVSRIVKIVHSR